MGRFPDAVLSFRHVVRQGQVFPTPIYGRRKNAPPVAQGARTFGRSQAGGRVVPANARTRQGGPCGWRKESRGVRLSP